MRAETTPRSGNANWRPVYGVVERDGRTYWPRIGIAFDNADGSVTVKLNAIPVGGKLQIQDRKEHDDQPPRSGRVLRVHGQKDLVGG
ncbi:MAG: hypothetical protein JJ863_14230 [Deltaproteobacteria bacterium]|nr:hypothetical protein [Deltaproteobacteria bacterium]